MQDLNEDLDYLKAEMARIGFGMYRFNQIIGSSPVIDKTKELAKKAAGNDFSVLLTGESETGKEVFASTIHYLNARREHPISR